MHALELKIPPCVLLALSMLAMSSFNHFIRLSAFAVPFQIELAFFSSLLGFSTILSAALTFRSKDTTIDPRKPEQSTTLVTQGIFRATRNPIYLGMALILLGWGLYLGNGLVLTLIPC